MPGFVTHHIFGVNSYKLIDNSKIKSRIKKYNKAFALGLQGPDLFFYFVPTSTGLLPDVAKLMHKQKTGEFLRQLIKACETIHDDYDYEVSYAYILGYVGHYILDTSVHPYVYYRVGTKASSEILGIHFGLETDIDRDVLMHYRGKSLTELDHKKAVDVTSDEQTAIAKLLHKAILATYDVDISIKMIKAAIVSFKLESSLMMDRSNNKYKLMTFFENHTIKHPLFSSLLINDVEHAKDACNEAKNTWHNPWDESAASNESIYELMDRKSKDYAKAMSLMADALDKAYERKPEKDPEILKVLGNLSFTSGLDCEIEISRE